jgi:hypothetical protein
MTNYTAGQRRFTEFCNREGYEIDKMTEEMLIHYIRELNSRKISYATVWQMKASFVLEMRTGTSVVFTCRVNRYLDAAKRLAAQRR